VTEVDKELPTCNFDEHYGYINTSTPYPRQRGTRKAHNVSYFPRPSRHAGGSGIQSFRYVLDTGLRRYDDYWTFDGGIKI